MFNELGITLVLIDSTVAAVPGECPVFELNSLSSTYLSSHKNVPNFPISFLLPPSYLVRPQVCQFQFSQFQYLKFCASSFNFTYLSSRVTFPCDDEIHSMGGQLGYRSRHIQHSSTLVKDSHQ